MEDFMKKIIVCSLLLSLFAATAQAGTALTSGQVTPAGVSVYGGVNAAAAAAAPSPLIKFSTGVSGLVNFANNTGYMLMTKHVSGSKIFGTANDSTSIFWTQAGTGILTNAKSIAPSSLNFTAANAWTSY
jgi:hypothetical protein